MKVVIGDQVFISSETPMVIRLTESDKAKLANMPEDHFYYGAFPIGTDPEIKDKTFKLAGWKKEDNTENTQPMSTKVTPKQEAMRIISSVVVASDRARKTRFDKLPSNLTREMGLLVARELYEVAQPDRKEFYQAVINEITLYR